MKYLNLSSSVNQEEMMLRATNEQKGVWLELICYCTQQMNGGMIQGCQEWTDDMWMRIAGVRASVVTTDSPLWHFSIMSGLVVHLYDDKAEEAYKKKQRMGRIYVERRWRAEQEKKIVRLSGKSDKSPTEQKHNPA